MARKRPPSKAIVRPVWGPAKTVHYNGYVEESKQGYSKVSKGPSITVHYNGYVEVSK
jgi:hypothetical protein